MTTFNDLHRHAGADAVRRCIEAATYPDGNGGRTVGIRKLVNMGEQEPQGGMTETERGDLVEIHTWLRRIGEPRESIAEVLVLCRKDPSTMAGYLASARLEVNQWT